jgi:two-component system copper resistance phosphate regulon response regulator CusR
VRVLVLEDDTLLRAGIVAELRRRGTSVDAVGTLAEADARLSLISYDVAVLDRTLPDGDAADLVHRLRSTGLSVPTLFLSCRDEVADRVAGLDAGADDYLGKPFAMVELLARIRSLGRRRGQVEPDLLRLGDLEIDRARARVTRGGRPITLTPKEYGVLEYLVRNAGVVISRTRMLEHCWDEFADPASNVVDTRIGRIRAKLGAPPLVRTVRGAGYLASDATDGS